MCVFVCVRACAARSGEGNAGPEKERVKREKKTLIISPSGISYTLSSLDNIN